MNKFKIYLKSILLPLILGGIVGLITSKTMDYETLAKPPLSPPGIIFPIVWSILYTLMGISFAQLEINNLHDSDTKKVYYEQLIVNLSWPIFFFTFKWRLFSILIILLLLILVIRMIRVFYRKEKLAGLLQIPYLLWVSFATYLNIFTYFLNN